MKASNLSRAAGVVKEHMPWIFMYLDQDMSMSVFYYSLKVIVCDCLLYNATEMFLMETTGGGGEYGIFYCLILSVSGSGLHPFQCMRHYSKYFK
jgi:hypothetical protein